MYIKVPARSPARNSTASSLDTRRIRNSLWRTLHAETIFVLCHSLQRLHRPKTSRLYGIACGKYALHTPIGLQAPALAYTPASASKQGRRAKTEGSSPLLCAFYQRFWERSRIRKFVSSPSHVSVGEQESLSERQYKKRCIF